LQPSEHAEALDEALKAPGNEDMFKSIYYGPFPALASFPTLIESWRQDTSRTLFIIYDLSKGEPVIAGFIGLLDGIASDLRAEIGAVTILKSQSIPVSGCELAD